MTCKQCGKELPEESKFCYACGSPVESEVAEAPAPAACEEPAQAPDGEAAFEPAAPEAPAPTKETPEKRSFFKQLLDDPAQIVGLLLAAISFVAGIILLSISLAGVLAAGYGVDCLVILPAFGALILNIFLFCKARKTEGKLQKLLSLIGICVAAFVLLFAFIACCVLNANYII